MGIFRPSNGLIALDMNGNLQYDPGIDDDPNVHLTEMVKFDYSGILTCVEALNNKSGSAAKYIYFALGSYTHADAERYVNKHVSQKPSDHIIIAQIENKPCLLFGYKDPLKAGTFIYQDFGSICPPPTSCGSSFTYR